MKTMKFTCLALLILTLPASRGEPFRTDINPALIYYRAFLVAPEPMSSTDSEYFFSKKGRSQNLPDRFGQIAAGYDNEFFLVRQAAHSTVPCDWGVDFSVGPNAMLPYLARAKAIVQAARVRAVWDLQHDRQADARDDLLAAFVLARNASRDGTLIGTLVQFACEAIVYSTVAQNFGRFSPETLKQLADGFAAAPPQRPVTTNVAGEKLNICDWLVNQILKLQQENPGNDAKVMEAIRPNYELIDSAQDYFGGKSGTNLWQRMVLASGGTSDGVLKLLRELDPLYARLAKITALPQKEYEGQIKDFDADVQKSPNPLMPVLLSFPPLSRVKEFRVQAQLAMVQAAIEYKLHGEAGLKTVNDPFGDGPFAFQQFVFKGAGRGFELKSAYAGTDAPFGLIFVEKQGPPFYIDGPHAGEAVTQ